MALTDELISQLVKVTNDRGIGNNDVTVYGTIVSDGNRNYVRIDGSDISTPVETTVEISPDDRVIVEIKNHTATVTGNTTDPSIGTKTADGIRSSITQTASEIRSEVVDEVNKLQSSITQTASEIRSEVADEVNGLRSSITHTSDSITSIVKKQDEFSEFKQTLEGFSFMSKGGTVKINGGDINLTGAIKFSDLSDANSKQTEINNAVNAANNANTNASQANINVNNVLTTVSGFTITQGMQTYIDGSMIYSNTIYANALHLGGALTVYDSMYSYTIGGYLGYDSGFNSDSGIGIRDSTQYSQVVCTNNASRISYGVPYSSGSFAQVVATSGYAYVHGSSAVVFTVGNTHYVTVSDHGTYGSLRPHANAPTMNLGNSSTRWGAVYATNGTIQTSDRNLKNNIENLPDKYITLFDNLCPRRFKMNEGTSNRYHVGYIAQEVEAAMNLAGIDSLEFGGFVRDKDADGNDVCMLRYGEFDAIYAAKIKQLETRLIALEKGER